MASIRPHGDRYQDVSTFRPLTTRGAFVPDTVIAARARTFQGMGAPRSQGFVAGFAASIVRAELPVAAAPPVVEPEPEPAPAEPAPEQVAAPVAPPPAPTPDPHAEELAELLHQNQLLAAEYAEREKVRTAEHAQLVADLDAQKAKTKAANDRLGQLAGELVRLREAMIQELRSHSGTLLLLGARKLAGEALRTQPGLLEGLVRETVETLAGANITVRVNPEDVERITESMGPAVRVVGDPQVRAGCIAEGEAGLVDASVDTAAGSLLTEVQAWKRTA